MKYFLTIPTYNGGDVWKQAVERISSNLPADFSVLVVDSGSKDDTVKWAEEAGFAVKHISSREFNHGGTRNLAASLAPEDCEVVVFLTQDALLEPGSLERIVACFADAKIACAYGRQLPHLDANPIASHARAFNYRQQSRTYSLEDIPTAGLKTVFSSNSFAAYRLSVFRELGGFPSDTILSEDMFFVAKAVMSGYKLAYVADSQVRHSHNYSCMEEFKRYFDIGVFHGKESWIREKFGGAGGEGKNFIFSEINYLVKNGVLYLPSAFLHNFFKILGYKLGQNYRALPANVTKSLSMHKRYWEQ
ncbi:glycosyltransferase family 2 protein [Candidatus Pantoea multigeneris]|uniref:Glycosyltransferase family 2 protein n=1 Tax=Candidatus Pantoea multigeneris TaxID=2608357 RepID=A0ABX0REI9_9GAMM|nr:glycosyltransferase [Pantoea multigeneris]NIF23038.1 glycosyltransferase family 2 protein [Pantoea multigeneris]